MSQEKTNQSWGGRFSEPVGRPFHTVRKRRGQDFTAPLLQACRRVGQERLREKHAGPRSDGRQFARFARRQKRDIRHPEFREDAPELIFHDVGKSSRNKKLRRAALGACRQFRHEGRTITHRPRGRFTAVA